MTRLLVVDDARDIAEGIALGVRLACPGCRVTSATGGREALERFAAEAFDLVVLDVAMPPPDGLAVCRHLREVSRVPILMLTVRDGTEDKVHALETGADDYLTKPFEPAELIARLRALRRRGRDWTAPPRPILAVGDVALDLVAREARVRGERVRLTVAEFRLLAALLRQPGAVLPHRTLLDEIWGGAYAGDVQSLKVFVRRLRQKLGDDPARPRYIGSAWGVGYRFLPPPDDTR